MATDHDGLVAELASIVGIWQRYVDAFGVLNEPSPATRRAILADFGLPAGTGGEARDSLERARLLLDGFAPLLVVATEGAPCRIPCKALPGTAVEWLVRDEHDGTSAGRSVAADGHVVLASLPAGYYRFTLTGAGRQAGGTIVCAPMRAYVPQALAGDRRIWGAAAQVYGLRSGADLGIGDFPLVAAAAVNTGRLGGDFLGLSPLHAMFSADRTRISPYSPSSRLFLDPLFIDPRAIEGFAGSEAARHLADPALKAHVEALRAAPLVDHAAVWAVKEPLLRALYAERAAPTDDPPPGLARFRQQGGEALVAHATFEAIFAKRLRLGETWSGAWPDALRHADAPGVPSFQNEHRTEIDFAVWLQWQANRQLAAAAEQAIGADGGMGIGLYRDLAVGADRGGSEVWSAPDLFAPRLSVGAPPDPLATQGQDWGLPPFDPIALRTQGLAAFRALVIANMRHAGAIRIDHAFQLSRLFLIPAGAPSREGTYVTFPFEAMVAVLRLESHRHHCAVIAEDLGNGPPGFSEAIMEAGLYSYRVLAFERTADGGFRRPDDYPAQALAVLGTHDLATFPGWWRGHDIEVRERIGLYDRNRAEAEFAGRAADRASFALALAEERLLASPEPPTEAPVVEATRYLARSRSQLTGIQLEDAAGEIDQPNLPGVSTGHPNWRRRLAATVGQLTGDEGGLARLAAAAAAEGRGWRCDHADGPGDPPAEETTPRTEPFAASTIALQRRTDEA